MGNYTFGKEERIRLRADFLRTFRDGEHHRTPHFRVFVYPNALSQRRLGISVSKRIGGSVERNRLKRRIREFFRLNKELIPESSDVVISAQEGAAQLDYGALCEELKGVFQKR